MARLPIDLLTSSNQVDPTGQAQTEKARPADFGSSVGAGLTDLGNAGESLAVKINANQQKLNDFNYEDQFIKLQDQDSQNYDVKLRGISGDANGFWQGARTDTQTTFANWIKTLPPEQQAQYQVKADRFVAARTQQAFRAQYEQQDTNTKQTIAQSNNTAGLQVQQAPETYDQYAQQQTDLINKSTLPAAEKQKLIAETTNKLAFTSEMARAQQNPDSVAVKSVPVFSPDVNAAVDNAAKAHGLDPAMLRRFVQVESSGKPGAQDPGSSYRGLGQLSDQEFAQYGRPGGNIFDATDNANALAAKISAEAAAFQNK